MTVMDRSEGQRGASCLRGAPGFIAALCLPCCSLILHSSPGEPDGDTGTNDVPADDVLAEEGAEAPPDIEDTESPMDMPDDVPFTSVSAGQSHTCGVTANGIMCWGLNGHGQLGDDTVVDRNRPAYVHNIGEGEYEISAGGAHTCMKSGADSAWCWGANGEGQLGVGSTTESHVPQELTGWFRVVIVSTGGTHTCAIADEGTPTSPYCWGSNSHRQVGIDGEAYYASPQPVSGTPTWNMRLIAAGGTHACGISTGGELLCWGGNEFGQLGTGTTEDTETPSVVDLGGTTVLTATAGGGHTCAHRMDGVVQCWGRNDRGQLGNGTTTGSSIPVAVAELPGAVAAVSAGGEHTCALMASNAVYCWGRNSEGQLGNAAWEDSSRAVLVTGLERSVVRVSAGGAHTCALMDTGAIMCWGDNEFGQLGDGTNNSSSLPVGILVD